MRLRGHMPLFVLLGAGFVPAIAKEPLFFEKDIRPILKTHCFHCHGEGEKLKGGVDLRLRHFLTNSTDNGPIVVPGKSSGLLLKLVRSGEMPKGEKKLSEEEIRKIETWIRGGAKVAHSEPAEVPKGFFITEEEKSFWSFQPIRRPAIPKSSRADRKRIRTPIDAFVLSRLHEKRLRPAPEADRETLIRRIYLDLHGLPPTPEEVSAFVADPSPEAYEHLVDQLLASPRYGERWGRHWLDVAGYADSNGFTESDSVRPHAWRYRDYVVESFNRNKPFNRFIEEQLAGDELAGPVGKTVSPAQAELLTATGFLRMAPDGTGDQVPDLELAKNQAIGETIKVVSSAFLGLTVGCAQCHDHRYDPISQEDYYRVRAIFDPAFNWKAWRNPAQRLVSLYTPEDRAKADAIEVEARKLDEAAQKLYRELLDKVFEREILKVPEALREKVRVARNTPREKRTPEQLALFKEYPAADVQFALDLYDPEANKKFLEATAKAAALRGTKPPEPFIMALTEVPGPSAPTFLFHRGDHEQPKQKVDPGEPMILASYFSNSIPHSVSNAPTSGRRLAFAHDLTSRQHPLTSRVLVNRFWMQHFGRGLVATPDFGRLGEKPVYPELLDWLASEFMDTGWDLKRLHKMILLSSVYRQSSENPAAQRIDPENKWLARANLRRLDAETLRDSILSASGSLHLKAFGPPVAIARDPEGRVVTGNQKTDGNGDPTGVDSLGPEGNRRSIFVQVRRKFPLTVLEAFDEPVMSPNCEARAVTTVAPQSLMLLNDSFILSQSLELAKRLRIEKPNDLDAQVARGWERVFGRSPNARDITRFTGFCHEQAQTLTAANAKKDKKEALTPEAIEEKALASLVQVWFGSNRFLYVE